MLTAKAFRVLLSFAGLGLLAGCGVQVTAPVQVSVKGMSGSVHGGQQPVVGSTIQLYAVGTTGDGSAATPLLTVPVVTTAGGNFNITGDYSCGSATQVYLTATGGNPGLATTNPNLSEMAALGPCSALTASTFISVNELTTVAATSALYPYMTSATAIGSGTGDAAALANAFALADTYVNTSSGLAPGVGVPSGMSVPVAELNTLADVLAVCMNSAGGTAGDGSVCGTLFSLTTPVGGAAPTNGIAAMLSVAQHPTFNTGGLYNLVPATAVFQPVLSSAPATFAVVLQSMAAAGTLTVSPGALTFGTTAVGFASVAQTITISNGSSAAIGLSGIAVSGTNASDFAQTNSCGTSVAAGASCAVTVIFTPGAIGSRTGSVGVATTAGTLQTVTLTGTGGVPSAGPITLSTSSLSYTINGSLQDVSIYNYGTTPLTLRGITLSSYYFTVQANTCGTQLPAQSACVVSVGSNGIYYDAGRFTYTTYTGTLTVDDDAAAGPQTVSLSETNTSSAGATYSGIYPKNGYLFGTGPVGTAQAGSVSFSSASYYVSIGGTASVSGTNATDFKLASTTCSSSTYTCSLVLTFTPSGVGLRTAKVLLDGSNQYLALSGVGTTGPSAGFLYVSSTYGQGTAVRNNYGVGTDTDTYTLVNNGTISLTPTFSFSGANAANYSQTNTCPSALAPGSSCPLKVTFSASAAGTYAGTLGVNDASSGYSTSLAVPFQVNYANPALTNGSLSFTIPVGTTSSASTSVETRDYTMTSVGDPFTISSSTTGNYSVTPQSCPASPTTLCTFTVTYAPQAATNGTVSETLVITDTTSGYTVDLGLNGTATNAKVSLSPSSLTFPPRTVGTTSLPSNVILTNTGTTSLSISSLSVVTAINGNFTQTNNCTTVAAGGNCTIAVQYSPSTSGNQAGMIKIVSNAVSSPDVISLSGSTQ